MLLTGHDNCNCMESLCTTPCIILPAGLKLWGCTGPGWPHHVQPDLAQLGCPRE